MKVNKKKQAGVTATLLIVLFLAGLSLLLYPTVSNLWNARLQVNAIGDYNEMVVSLDKTAYTQMWEDARTYNQELAARGNIYGLPKDLEQR